MSKLKLEVGKRYADGNGDKYKVLVDRRDYGRTGNYPFVAIEVSGGGDVRFYRENGVCAVSLPGRNLIREITPYDDWPIDTPVIVHDEGHDPEDYQKGHWAGVHDGKPSVWTAGRTSHTALNEGDWIPWYYAELAEDVE